MDYEKTINALNRAWDALEGLSVSGFTTRAKVQAAQETILWVYNEVVRAQKKAENEDTSEIPGEE